LLQFGDAVTNRLQHVIPIQKSFTPTGRVVRLIPLHLPVPGGFFPTQFNQFSGG
jgi:hypothetical protein